MESSTDSKKAVKSYEDLDVYQKLLQLHLEVHSLTLTFPKFEMYELGSQLRRSTNSIPANPAEGWNNRHINILSGRNQQGLRRTPGDPPSTDNCSQEEKKRFRSSLNGTKNVRECFEDFKPLFFNKDPNSPSP